MSEDFYDIHAQDFYNQTVNVDMSGLYVQFLNLIPVGGSILDAGCGSGRDSHFFLNAGYNVTSIDASEEMVRLSSELINKQVYQMKFQEIEYVNQYNAIWACASLLHVSRREIDDVIERLAKALKPNGIIYASFKYGDKEEYNNERFFNYYNEISFGQLMERHTSLRIIETWITKDARKDRHEDLWFNVLLNKQY